MSINKLIFLFVASVVSATIGIVGYARVITGQAVDESGAPQFRVDPFWPKPLPNRWSMQQVTCLVRIVPGEERCAAGGAALLRVPAHDPGELARHTGRQVIGPFF
jgi:hypothetical protein